MAKKKEEIEPVEEVKPGKVTLRFKKPFKGAFNNVYIDAKEDDVIEVPEVVATWIKQFNVC